MLPDSRSWAPAPTRIATVTVNAGICAPGTPVVVNFQLPSLTDILSIASNNPAWITLYSTYAGVLSDASRLITVDPVAGTGVIADVATTTPVPSISLSPVPVFNNTTSLPVALAYISIRNQGGSSVPITVTITHRAEQF